MSADSFSYKLLFRLEDRTEEVKEAEDYFEKLSEPREYIFPRPRKVSPRDGTEVKTCFICRGKVSFSAVVEKKDSCLTERSSCLTDRSSCLPERSKGRQRREVRQRSEVRQSF